MVLNEVYEVWSSLRVEFNGIKSPSMNCAKMMAFTVIKKYNTGFKLALNIFGKLLNIAQQF